MENGNQDRRRRAYLALRLKKAGSKALHDITPPLFWRWVAGKPAAKRGKAELLRDRNDAPFTVGNNGPQRFAFLAGQPAICLPVSCMRYAGALRFSAREHHFVRYLEDGIDALAAFYRNHQPGDVLEKHFLPASGRPDTPLRGLPWIEYGDGEFDRGVPSEKGLAAHHGHQHHGPVSREKLEMEASHLDRLLASFQKHGMRKTNDLPAGHFIIDDDGNWAFYVKDGQHRIAVMAHLGFSEALVTLSSGVRIVREADISLFPMVREGLLTQQEARKILRAYTRPLEKPDLFAGR